MTAVAMALALLLAGCSLTPKRVEFGASSANRDCTQGCLHVAPRRIKFRFSF